MYKEIHNLLKIENDNTTIFTNKELKMIDDYIKELESYKYNMDRDYLRLEKENQSLKKENKILRENAEHNDKVVDKVNWENQKLKKQIDKSIEYIQNHQLVFRYHTTEEIDEWFNQFYKDVLDILRGKINE